jgi:ABC-2 type transport system permease protein
LFGAETHLECGGNRGTYDQSSFQDLPERGSGAEEPFTVDWQQHLRPGWAHSTFEIAVDQPPTLAGIDPYNKLIDRNADDNMIAVTKQ